MNPLSPAQADFAFHSRGLIPFPVEHSAFVEVLDRTVTPCKAIHNPTSAIQNGISPTASPVYRIHFSKTISRPCGSAAPGRDDHRFFLGGLCPPKPSRGQGHGETRFPHAPAGRGRGETRFPHTPLREPMFTSAVHAAPPHPDGMKIILGRATPSQTLPPGGGMGKPGFPIPLFESLCSPQPSVRLRRTRTG